MSVVKQYKKITVDFYLLWFFVIFGKTISITVMGNSIKCPVCKQMVMVRSNTVTPIGFDHEIQMVTSDCGHLCGCIDNAYYVNTIRVLNNLTKQLGVLKNQ